VAEGGFEVERVSYAQRLTDQECHRFGVADEELAVARKPAE
jgi:hypothetical protein